MQNLPTQIMFSKQLYIKYSTCTYVRGNFSVSIKNDVCNTRLTSTSTKQLISSNSGSLSTTQNAKLQVISDPALFSPPCMRANHPHRMFRHAARETLRPPCSCASTKLQRSRVTKLARGMRHPAMKIQVSIFSIS